MRLAGIPGGATPRRRRRARCTRRRCPAPVRSSTTRAKWWPWTAKVGALQARPARSTVTVPRRRCAPRPSPRSRRRSAASVRGPAAVMGVLARRHGRHPAPREPGNGCVGAGYALSGTRHPATVAPMTRRGPPHERSRPPGRAEEWLARLDTEAAVLPEDQRTELRSLVEEQLAAADGRRPATTTAYEQALAQLGSPEALVAEAGGYAVPPRGRLEPPEDLTGTDAESDAGPPWLEVGVLAVLVTSVVLALVPATEAVAPAFWFVGRSWSCCPAAGVRRTRAGRPGVRCPRGAAPAARPGRAGHGASVVVAVALVVLWLAVSVRLVHRARAPRDQGRGLRMR